MNALIKSLSFITMISTATFPLNAENSLSSQWGSVLRQKETTEISSSSSSIASNATFSTEELQSGLSSFVSTLVSKGAGLSENLPAFNLSIPDDFSAMLKGVSESTKDALVGKVNEKLSETSDQVMSKAMAMLPDALEQVDFKKMNPSALLSGGGDGSVAKALESQTREWMKTQLKPVIDSVAAKTGLKSSLKECQDAIPQEATSLLGGFGKKMGVDLSKAFDMENYVSDQVLNRLYDTLKKQEAALRENPALLKDKLLQKILGAQ